MIPAFRFLLIFILLFASVSASVQSETRVHVIEKGSEPLHQLSLRQANDAFREKVEVDYTVCGVGAKAEAIRQQTLLDAYNRLKGESDKYRLITVNETIPAYAVYTQ